MPFAYILVPSLLLFVVGAAVGSFLNVVITRTIERRQWVKGRSVCDHCGRDLQWYELIPLLSYLIQGGRSRCCKKKLSISHPVVEMLTASLFVWWYVVGFFIYFQLSTLEFSIIQPLFWLIVGILLLVIFVSDWYYMLIPDSILTLLLLLAFSYRIGLLATRVMQPRDFSLMMVAMAGMVLFFGGLWWFTRGRGLGFGDVLLSMPLTLLVGWPNVLVATFLSFLLGAVIGVGLLASGVRKLGQPIPFGPFMIAGSLIALVWGDVLLRWYIGLL